MKNQCSANHPITKCGFIILFAFLLLTTRSKGQDTQDSTTSMENLSLKELLNTKVTTVSKTSQELETAPATVVVISAEQIKVRGYQSLLDVMYDLPDMKIDDKVYSGVRTSFVFRGTQGLQKFVLLLDGISITSPSGDPIPIMENYPVNLAEQIEVVYGPASALYGANAVSCVINIITKKNKSNKNLSVEASAAAGMYGYTNNTLFITKKITDHVSIVLSGQYSYDQGVDYSEYYKDDSSLNVDGYSTGTLNSVYGPMTPVKPISSGNYEAPMTAYNFYGALHIDDFTFSYFRNDCTTPAAFGSNTSNTIYNKDVYMRQSIDVANASYKKTINKLSTTTTLSASNYKLDPRSSYRNLYTGFESAYKYGASTMIKAEQQVDCKISNKTSLTGGISYEVYNTIPQSTDLSSPVNTDNNIDGSYSGTTSYYLPEGLSASFYNIRYHNIGNYIQLQYAPLHALHFTMGARYDINSRYGNTFNPRLGVVYNPFKKTTIKILYGSAFLAPSGSDSYAQYGSFDTQDSGKTFHSYFLHLPNPNLNPILSKNAELSIRQYISNNFSITVDGYFTFLSGLLDFADDNATTHLYNNQFNGIPVDYVEVYTNQNTQENYGGSILFNWKWKAGRLHANTYISASYVDGVINNALKESDETTPDEELEFIAPYMMHAGADLKRGKISFSPRLTLMGRQNIAGISDYSSRVLKRQTIPGYALVNLSMRYSFTKKLSVFANVTNALNQKYRSVGFNMDLENKNADVFYGQPEDPIRIMGGVSFNY